MKLDPAEIARRLPFEERYERRRRRWADGPHESREAFDRVTEREVVLNLAWRRGHVPGFLRSAQLASSLRHPNLLPAHDLGITGGERPFYTNPPVREKPRPQLLRESHDEGPSSRPGLPVLPLARALRDACRAPDYAHRLGLLHLGLHPDSLLIGEDSHVILNVVGWVEVGPAGGGEADGFRAVRLKALAYEPEERYPSAAKMAEAIEEPEEARTSPSKAAQPPSPPSPTDVNVEGLLMKRSLLPALAFGMLSGLGPVGCSDETQVSPKETVSTPGGTTTTDSTKSGSTPPSLTPGSAPAGGTGQPGPAPPAPIGAGPTTPPPPPPVPKDGPPTPTGNPPLDRPRERTKGDRPPRHATPKTAEARQAPPAPAPSAPEAVTQSRAALETGRLAYNAPSAMSLGETVTITLRLSRVATAAELQAGITDPGPKKAFEITVTPYMKALLSGPPSAFDITPSFDPAFPQEVTPTGTNEWKWDVTAKKRGLHRLHVSVFSLVKSEGQQTITYQRTFDQPIAVNVTLAQRVSTFVGDNWQWLWVTLPASAVGAYGFLKRWRNPKTGPTP